MAEDMPGSEHKHPISFSRNLYIEREDFMEIAPNKKYFRLYVGGEVRLKNAYIIKCERVEKDVDGNISAIICTYDPLSKSGDVNAGRKVKGTLHWADANTALPAEYRIYGPLMDDSKEGDLADRLSDDSKKVMYGFIEPEIKNAKPGDKFQLLRKGYFCADSKDFSPEHIVMNMTTGLRDSFKKIIK